MNIQLAPAVLNCSLCSGLAVYVGSTWTLPVTISERTVSEGHIIDVPVDLSGLSGRAAIKAWAGADQPIALPTVEITDPTQGQILISLTAEETAAIIVQGNTWRDVTTYEWDCYLDDAETGDSWRILQGSIDISPSCTDSNDHS